MHEDDRNHYGCLVDVFSRHPAGRCAWGEDAKRSSQQPGCHHRLNHLRDARPAATTIIIVAMAVGTPQDEHQARASNPPHAEHGVVCRRWCQAISTHKLTNTPAPKVAYFRSDQYPL